MKTKLIIWVIGLLVLITVAGAATYQQCELGMREVNKVINSSKQALARESAVIADCDVDLAKTDAQLGAEVRIAKAAKRSRSIASINTALATLNNIPTKYGEINTSIVSLLSDNPDNVALQGLKGKRDLLITDMNAAKAEIQAYLDSL